MTQPPEKDAFEILLEYIKLNRGFDFTGYKRSSLIRRVNKRMREVNVEGYLNYQDYLEVHPEELAQLFNTLLINVTAFFRNAAAWDVIRREIVPQILARKTEADPIRVWSVGCASGQEAYTLAILLAEELGIEQFRQRVKIYATDVDQEALNEARHATYPARQMEGLSPEQIQTFFEQIDGRYIFRKDLRGTVIFGRHDLIQDAPIAKIDLLVCRNTLMYFNAETQSKILNRFHFALQNRGFLFLGQAEMLLAHTDIFSPEHLKYRIFSKIPPAQIHERQQFLGQSNVNELTGYFSSHFRLREAAFNSGPEAQMVVNSDGQLVLANERARELFKLTSRDLGRPLQDLEVSYRPIELRSPVEQCRDSGRTHILSDVTWHPPGNDIICADVQFTPLFDRDNCLLGVSIHFLDLTRYKRLQENLEQANQALEMAYEELQSSNEELETMNEELHATNEELQTLNDEFQRSSDELHQTNNFLQAILASLKGGVIVLDAELRVRIWNDKAENLWGLRFEETVGKHFLNLDVGLPVEQLRQPMRDGLAGTQTATEVILQAVNRRGRPIQCRVSCTSLIGLNGQIQGIILLMEAVEP